MSGESNGVRAALITAAAAIVVAVIGYFATTHKDSTPHVDPPPVTSPASVPVADPISTAPPPQSVFVVVVDCKAPQTTTRGATIQVTYTVTSTTEILVSVGAALYDEAGDDHSNGSGDQDNYQLHAGSNTIARSVSIPASLSRGSYELAAEIWTNNKIGQGETLADKSCGKVRVA